MKFNEETKHFSHYSDFKRWLSTYEKETVSNFTKSSGEKKLKGGTPSEYWLCSRSGNYREPDPNERKRKQKEIRTIKIEMNCTSTIKVIQNPLVAAPNVTTATTQIQINSTPQVRNKLPMHMSPVSVLICHTHYGHECDMEYTWHKVPKKKDRRRQANKQVHKFEVDEVDNVGEMKQHINNQLLMIAQQVEYTNSNTNNTNDPNNPDSNMQIEGSDSNIRSLCPNSNITALQTLYKGLATVFSTYNTSVSSQSVGMSVSSQSVGMSVGGTSTDTPSASKHIKLEHHTSANRHQSNNVIFN